MPQHPTQFILCQKLQVYDRIKCSRNFSFNHYNSNDAKAATHFLHWTIKYNVINIIIPIYQGTQIFCCIHSLLSAFIFYVKFLCFSDFFIHKINIINTVYSIQQQYFKIIYKIEYFKSYFNIVSNRIWWIYLLTKQITFIM